MTSATTRRVDVAVLGGGLAGMATALHLARGGLTVLCVEPRSWPRDTVGESLEFSAPRLLDELGLDDARLDGVAHPKTTVRIVETDAQFTVWPPPFFGRPPIWCSRRTFHVDRRELDKRVMESAVAEGVELVQARVTDVHHHDRTITGVTLDDDTHVEASFYIDASGHNARLVGRALALDRDLLGAPRWAYWTRLPVPTPGEATVLRFPDPRAGQLCWMWEIPLNDREVSVGLVLGEAELAHQRTLGRRPHQILEHHLAAAARGAADPSDRPLSVRTTSYVPFRHRRPVGPNWILVGDASAMVDPLTSNGVTSALRHAALASQIVKRTGPGRRISRSDAEHYRASAPALVGTLNRAIESFLYEPAIRRRLGLRAAVTLYAATGVITNSLYARIGPTTRTRAVAVGALLGVARVWTGTARRVAAGPPTRRTRDRQRIRESP